MSTQPSDTPRTDAESIYLSGDPDAEMFIPSSFARALERELAEATTFREMVRNDNHRLASELAARDALIGEYETALRKIKDKAEALQKIPYGPDGDCGADRLANLIEEDAERALMKALHRADGKEGETV